MTSHASPPSGITLSTIGSRSVTVAVSPGVLDDSVLAVTLGLHDGPLSVAFTAAEALWLRDQINAVLEART